MKTNYKSWDCIQPDWTKIEDLSVFGLDGIRQLHPQDPRYISYWRDEKKKAIEGVWKKQFGKYMHMPGCLYFYGKYGIIVDTNKYTKETKKINPLIHDLEWEQAYYFWEVRGFSGWSEDDVYTSDHELLEVLAEEGIPTAQQLEDGDVDFKNAVLNVLNSEGKLKIYKDPRTNLRELKDRPMGRPLFQSQAKNKMTVGSRGGGKSFFEAIGVHLYTIVFDGATRYDRSIIQKIETCIGSGDTDKSGELVQKIVDAMNEFAVNPELGAWGEQGDKDWTPNPFYRDMNGPTGPGNKQKGGWAHNYEKKINGRWVDGFGTGTRLFHVSYSSNKKAGAEAGAGGRYNVTSIEETGLTALVIDAWNSNRATVRRNGVQFGVQSFLGTSGNVELILPTKEMFTNPREFNIVSFPNVWEDPEEEIGFFLPAYMTFRQYKDKNGNTDVEAARRHWLKEYEESAKSANPKTIRMFCMNYPDIPSHMWVTDEQYLLPYEEAVAREKELMQGNLYKEIGTAIELRWDSTKDSGIEYDVVHNPEPFFEYPIKKSRESIDGEVMIYQYPMKVRGAVPNDMYFFVHDPYVSDSQDDGGSLGVTYGFLNPKYGTTHDGNQLVCSYIGKPKGGKKAYYSNLEKLLSMYGNPFRGLVYEANRGEYCRSYFEKKGKLHLLALRPQHAKGDKIFESKITQFGYMVGANGAISKMTMIDDTADWLLSETERAEGTKLIIETIPCIFLLRQIKQFEIKGNYDAVSSMILVPTFLSEQESFLIQIRKEKAKNRLTLLSTNNFLHGKQSHNKRERKNIQRIT